MAEETDAQDYMKLERIIINWAKESLKDNPDLSFAIMVIILLCGMTPTIFLCDFSILQTIVIAIIIVAIVVIACFALYVFNKKGKERKSEDSTKKVKAIDSSYNVVRGQNR